MIVIIIVMVVITNEHGGLTRCAWARMYDGGSRMQNGRRSN
jgi:hypothetical protein